MNFDFFSPKCCYPFNSGVCSSVDIDAGQMRVCTQPTAQIKSPHPFHLRLACLYWYKTLPKRGQKHSNVASHRNQKVALESCGGGEEKWKNSACCFSTNLVLDRRIRWRRFRDLRPWTSGRGG